MEKTIAAISTAPAPGGIGIVRISGGEAFAVAEKVFRGVSGKKVSQMKGYTAQLGGAYTPGGEKLDDVVALMLPHSPQTEGLMDARRLRLMKEDAILLSMGRGSVLDQEALAAVMGEGRLWGAALDVTVPEPLPQDSPLWTIPNLIITPHSAGGMRLEVTRANCVRQALDNPWKIWCGDRNKLRRADESARLPVFRKVDQSVPSHGRGPVSPAAGPPGAGRPERAGWPR